MVSFEFLRGIAGVIGIGAAYMTGRTLVLVRKGFVKQFRLFAWIFRFVLCMIAVAYGHSIDASEAVIWMLSAIAFGAAVWQYSREKPAEEDLTKTMFPPDE